MTEVWTGLAKCCRRGFRSGEGLGLGEIWMEKRQGGLGGFGAPRSPRAVPRPATNVVCTERGLLEPRSAAPALAAALATWKQASPTTISFEGLSQ